MAAVVFALAYGQIEDPSFRTGVNLTLLEVGVTDSRGNFVPGLLRDHFEVKENGIRRDISRFGLGSENVALAVAVDYSGSMTPRRNAVVQSIRTFVSLLQPLDEAALFTFNERPSRVSALAAVGSGLPQEWPSELLRRATGGQTGLYDAAIHASDELDQSKYERRVIVILSDGKDTASASTLKDAVAKLQSSNRLVYCVGLFRPGETDTDAGALRKLAESTGGIALFNGEGTGLTEALTKIMTDLRSRYILEFHSPEAPPGTTQVRRLTVSARDAKGRRLKVRAREEYRVVGLTAVENPK